MEDAYEGEAVSTVRATGRRKWLDDDRKLAEFSEKSTEEEPRLFGGRAKVAVMPHPREALRQNVQKHSSNEFVWRQAHHLRLAGGGASPLQAHVPQSIIPE